MEPEESAEFVKQMLARGWQFRDSLLVGFSGDIWFSLSNPWHGSLEDFRVVMLARTKGGYNEANSVLSLADYTALVEVLDGMCPYSLRDFFERIRPAFDELVEQHGARVTRYYARSPSWSLGFRHPRDGVAGIELMAESKSEASIWVYWWIDDFETGERKSHPFKSQTDRFEASAAIVKGQLKEAIQNVVNWPKEVNWKVTKPRQPMTGEDLEMAKKHELNYWPKFIA